MIVMKFGGTSVQDETAIRNAADIVLGRLSQAPVVVVSAMARVTEALLSIARSAKERRVDEAVSGIEALRERHLATASALLAKQAPVLAKVESEINALLDELENLVRSVATLGELTSRSQDAIVSIGERLSSLI